METTTSMDKYEVVIFWSEDDQAFVAEMPGCMADGATREETLQNLQVVAQQWIATAQSLGRTVPKPQPHLERRTLIGV